MSMKKPPTKEQVDQALRHCTQYFKKNLSGYIGAAPKKTSGAWKRVRDQAENWMEVMGKSCVSITFTHEGEPVTPEMIADWHFENASVPKLIDIKAVPKYPIERIKIELIVEDGNGEREGD